MKKEIASNNFANYCYDPKTHLFEQIWANPKGFMTVDDYKKELLFFRKQIETNQYSVVLSDLLNFNFIIVPELQIWVDLHITTQIAHIIQRIAFVLPNDIFTVVALEQTLDTETGIRERKKIEYFEDRELAIKWLLKS